MQGRVSDPDRRFEILTDGSVAPDCTVGQPCLTDPLREHGEFTTCLLMEAALIVSVAKQKARQRCRAFVIVEL